MKYRFVLLPLIGLVLAAAPGQVQDGVEREVVLLSPQDAEQLRGTVALSARATVRANDFLYYLPDVRITDEQGEARGQFELRPVPNEAGSYRGEWDTAAFPDGLYTLRVRVPYLEERQRRAELVEAIDVGVRNSPRPVARIQLRRLAGRARVGDEGVEIEALVTDDRRQPAGGVRLEWKTELGEFLDEATISERDGRTSNLLTSKTPGLARLTLTGGGQVIHSEITIAP